MERNNSFREVFDLYAGGTSSRGCARAARRDRDIAADMRAWMQLARAGGSPAPLPVMLMHLY